MLTLRSAYAAIPLMLGAMLTALLTACGGGGSSGGSGGGSGDNGTPAASPALVFSPALVNATINAGTSLTLNVIATVQRPADFAGATTVFATLTDTTGVIQPTVQLIKDSDVQYHAVLQSAPSLAAGSHTGNFNVKLCRDSGCASQFPGSPMLLPYALQVVPAGQTTFSATSTLPLTATAHLGGAAPASASVAIAAAGRSWSASTGGAAWLKLGAASGTGDATLTVSYNTVGLALGQYSTTLTIAASDGQSAALPVSLTVLPSGLVTGSDGITFNAINGAPIPSQIVSLDTDDKTSTTWNLSIGAAWLKASPTSGITPASTVLTVDPTVGTLASGSYPGSIALTAPGLATHSLPVTLNLTPATMLASSNSLILGGPYGRDFSTTAPLALSLNTSTNSWPWSLVGLPVWATANTSGGSINQSGATVVFTAKPASAPIGISSQILGSWAHVNGDTVGAGTLLTINKDRHKLIPSVTGVGFSGTPGWTRLTRTLTVSDNFGSFGGMSAVSSQTWLVAGVSGNQLSLVADPSQLTPDTLNIATVTLTALDPDAVAPEPIRVALWKGTLTPLANVTLPLPYTTVVTDPIRPLAYAHNGGAYIDVYNLYSGQKVATMTGFSTTLGDIIPGANGDYLYVNDIAASRITIVDLNTRRIATQIPLASALPQNTRFKIIRPNGVEMLVVSDGTAYQTATGQRLASLPLSSGTLAASGDGKLLLQQDEGNASVQQTSVSVDYAELSGGMLFSARIPAASHGGPGTQGQDIAVSQDGTRIYSASSTPKLCSVASPADLGVLAYLAAGDGAPNNIELGSDGRIYCGAAAKASSSDVWAYDTTGKLLGQFKLAVNGHQLLPRQMGISGDGLLLIGITDDGATTVVPVGP